MFKGRKKSYQPLTNREIVGEDPYKRAYKPSEDLNLPQGNLRAELVSVPNTIPFTEALEKVRNCIQNIQFYVTELENKLVFLHESFGHLESIKTPGTLKTYVTSPKTPQQIEILLRDNKQTIEHIAKQGGSIIFPRKDPPKGANCQPKSKVESKKDPRRHSDSSYTSESEHSSALGPVLPRNRVKKGSLIAQKGPSRHTTKPKRKQGHSKVGKNSPCKEPKGDNFENFVQKVLKNLNDTQITQ